MEKEEIARIVRQAVLGAMLDAHPAPQPIIEKLEYVLGCAEIAQAVVQRLGLDTPDK